MSALGKRRVCFMLEVASESRSSVEGCMYITQYDSTVYIGIAMGGPVFLYLYACACTMYMYVH